MKIICYFLRYKTNDVQKSVGLGVTFNNAVLRYPTNILNPIIRVDLEELTTGNTAIPSYTYAYIEDFSRYYFIENINAVTNGIFDLYLHVDVLQTYIGASTGFLRYQTVFVERSSESSLYNEWYEDDRINFEYKNNVTYIKPTNTVTNDFGLTSIKFKELLNTTYKYDNRTVVISLTGTNNTYSNPSPDSPYTYNSGTFYQNMTPSYLGCREYLLTHNQAIQVLNELLTDDTKASFVRSVRVLPYCLTAGSASLDNANGIITYGNNQTITISTELNVYTIGGYHEYKFFECDLSAYEPSNFYENNGYTKLELYVPYVGWKTIDLNEFYYKSTISVNYVVNYDTGTCFAHILLDGYLYSTSECKLGIDIPINSTNAYENARKGEAIGTQAVIGSVAGILSVAAGVALSSTGGGAAMGIPMIIGGGASIGVTAANAVAQGLQIYDYGTKNLGITDDNLYLYDTCMLRITSKNLSQPLTSAWLDENGRPAKVNVAMYSITGYAEIGKCDFSIGNKTEEQELISLLQNGVHFPTSSGW